MWNNKFMRMGSGWALSFGANGNLGVWGLGMYGQGFNICRINNTGVTNPGNGLFYIHENWNVGIGLGWLGGTQYPKHRLDVRGDIGNNGTIWHTSDKRYKKDIQPLNEDADKLLKLNSIKYKKLSEILKSEYEKCKNLLNVETDSSKIILHKTNLSGLQKLIDETDANKTTYFGFIAQELREIYPNLVYEDKEGYLSVNYTEMIPVLVDAIKELKTEINELKGVSFDKNATVVLSSAKLYQNNPNPFSENTEIKFYVPESSNSAMICIYDLVGSQIMKFENLNKGYSSLTVRGSELKAGMYIYALLVDGKEIDTKRMILTDK